MKSSEEGSSKQKEGKYRLFLAFCLAIGITFLSLGLRTAEGSVFPLSAASWADFSVSEDLYVKASGTPAFGSSFDLELALVDGMSISSSAPSMVLSEKALKTLGGIGGGFDADFQRHMFKYEVQEGDTISSVADRYGITEETVLWANELQLGAVLREGQQLTILPVSGALHLVRSYDTLSEIALWYKGSVQDIMEFNNIASEKEVYAGDLIIVPHGVKPKSLPSSRLTPMASSYFIYPISSPHRVTQGLHTYNAIDFSNGVCGEPVYAVAGGTVQLTGYHNIGGNYVRILHPNGVITYYGHLSQILVTKGEQVRQGQTIGRTGHTGYTIPAGPGGCHVHFEVRGASNPFLK
ncbi:MAG: peptidoglycan DD-metalloendopeptidase family protein [bacterium]|nr:peptidoglycan DD-metalloendopeptidase family protein [bacterium]